MAYPLFYERSTSRQLSVGREGADEDVEFIAVGSNNEVEVYNAAISDSPLAYFGLYRKAIKIRPRGGPYMDVTITYGNIPANEALGVEGAGGSGGSIPEPTAPDNSAPLGPGHGFTVSAGTVKIVQSLKTISRNRMLDVTAQPGAFNALPGAAVDYKGAIGVTRDTVEGCEVYAPVSELTKEVRRAFVSLDYYRTIVSLVGKTNDSVFYGFARGEMLYLGAEGRYSTQDAWLLTHKFAAARNRTNYDIKDGDGKVQFRIPSIKGWEYLWLGYDHQKDLVAERKTVVAYQANVEQVYEEGTFELLEIGA
jgi:hypothetical protein